MKRLTVIALGVLMATACLRQEEMSVSKEIERSTGKLYLLKNGGPLKFGEVSYTIYETGLISFHGDVSYVVPGTLIEIDTPFTRNFHTDMENIKSSRYRVQGDYRLPIERLDMTVKSADAEKKISVLSGHIARYTHWTDRFYRAERIELTVDTSKEIVRIINAKIYDAQIEYGVDQQSPLPESPYYDDEDGDEANYSAESSVYLDGFDTFYLESGDVSIELVDQLPVK